MAAIGVRCTRGLVSFKEHERCQLEEIGPPCGINPTVLNLMLRPQEGREGMEFSSSSLSNCHRRTILGHKHDYYINVDARYKMIRGSIIHEGLAHEPPPPLTLGVVRELHMQTPINVDGEERIFHGTPDQVVLLNVEEYIEVDGAYPVRQRLHVRIDDFKSISELGHDLVEPRKDNVYQINAYSYLVQKYLSEWLNYLDHPRDEWPKEYKDHLFLADGVELPNVDEVVIDELSIMYLDMKKTRTFTSKGFGYAQGKQLGDYTDGKWRRRYPVEHEQIELSPIPHFSNSFIESKIKSGIRRQLESETLLAPPLEPERAAIMCRNCPVLDKCIEVGLEEGYTMVDQLPYASRG